MKRYVYDSSGTKLLREDEAEPECGEDFCDRCGDCLACYNCDPCLETEDEEHFWVHYEEESDD